MRLVVVRSVLCLVMLTMVPAFAPPVTHAAAPGNVQIAPRGQSMAIPLVLYPLLSRRYFDGQLYRGGTLWFEALRTRKTEFRIIVTGKLVRPDGPYTRVRRAFTTPSRVWDKDQVIVF